MNTYRIQGQLTYNEAETESGRETININEKFNSDADNCHEAFGEFLADHEEFDFFGSLKSCDVETSGKKGATFYDSNEEQWIDVDLED